MIKTLLNDNKNEKVLFDLHIDGKEQTKRISSKILKIDENNQYDQAMKKPLPYGCIKKEHPPSFIKFNRILDGLSHNDIIGHLFKVNITFNNINAKTLLFNKLYPPIFEKNKKRETFERSTLQLLSIMVRDENKEKINSFRTHLKHILP